MCIEIIIIEGKKKIALSEGMRKGKRELEIM